MTPEDLKSLLERLGVRGVVQRNNNWQALCPFHPETRPSWGISFEPPHFHGCFGCGAKGSLTTLLVKVGGWSEDRARKFTGLTSRPFPSLRSPEKKDLKTVDESELYPLVLSTRARRYAIKRGLSDRTITALGLLHEPDTDRLLFPWYVGSKLVGVTGRALNPAELVKTLPFYGTVKGQCLYLPNRGIVPDEPLIVVEGETDAAKVFDAGFKNVGALCFGGLSKRQESFILNSGVSEVVLFLDDDSRGRSLAHHLRIGLRSRITVSQVNWSPFYSKYSSLTGGKLDPACLARSDIRKAISSCITRNSAWPSFSLGVSTSVR